MKQKLKMKKIWFCFFIYIPNLKPVQPYVSKDHEFNSLPTIKIPIVTQQKKSILFFLILFLWHQISFNLCVWVSFACFSCYKHKKGLSFLFYWEWANQQNKMMKKTKIFNIIKIYENFWFHLFLFFFFFWVLCYYCCCYKFWV